MEIFTILKEEGYQNGQFWTLMPASYLPKNQKYLSRVKTYLYGISLYYLFSDMYPPTAVANSSCCGKW